MPQDWEPKDWGEEQAHRVATEVRRLRGAQSTQGLSDRTDELGYRVSRSVIADLENGRRRYVTTAELCVLAWALRVPPVQLLYPQMPDGKVEVVPGIEKPSIEAAQWFSGEMAYGPRDLSTDAARQETLEFHRGVQLVDLSRKRLERQARIESLSRLVARLKGSGEDVENILAEIESAEERVADINAELRLIDGAVVTDGG
jgi:hypothetical protein